MRIDVEVTAVTYSQKMLAWYAVCVYFDVLKRVHNEIYTTLNLYLAA